MLIVHSVLHTKPAGRSSSLMMLLQAVVAAAPGLAGGLSARERGGGAGGARHLIGGVGGADDFHHNPERDDKDRDPESRFDCDRAALPAPEAARGAAQSGTRQIRPTGRPR